MPKFVFGNLSFLALLLGLYSCGPNAPIDIELNSNCLSEAGGSCAAASNGGKFTWYLENAPASQEYMIAVMSLASTDRVSNYIHPIQVTTNLPSSAIPQSEQEMIAQVKNLKNIDMSVGSWDANIFAPLPNFQTTPQNIGVDEFYIPDPNNYVTHTPTNTIPYMPSMPESSQLTGRVSQTDIFSRLDGVFQILVDMKTFGGKASQLDANYQSIFRNLDTCLRRVMPQTMNLIGAPLFRLNGKNAVDVLVGDIPQVNGRATAGQISQIDRFMTNRGQPLKDSNRTEVLYVQRTTSTDSVSTQCSTTAHEYQHLISFDSKVLSRMPPETRFDLDTQRAMAIHPERLGFDEGYSSIVEELTEEKQSVSRNIVAFLSNPNSTSFALEAVYREAASNFRSRGINTLFLYSMLKRAGGSLNASDPATQKFLSSLIRSQETGFDNVAGFFGSNWLEVQQYFFTRMVRALYDSKKISEFIPALEEKPIAGGSIKRGIRILDRATPPTSVTLNPPIVHPLQFDAPLVPNASTYNVPAQSVMFFRYIVPEKKKFNARITLATGGAPYSIFVIPVR
ncbi:MAG: hypothetical protein J0L93_08590 [Deltaproteobacteria bacterium]|nr:hypothetical protein [Deltaproteobacteria bacterium]